MQQIGTPRSSSLSLVRQYDRRLDNIMRVTKAPLACVAFVAGLPCLSPLRTSQPLVQPTSQRTSTVSRPALTDPSMRALFTRFAYIKRGLDVTAQTQTFFVQHGTKQDKSEDDRILRKSPGLKFSYNVLFAKPATLREPTSYPTPPT